MRSCSDPVKVKEAIDRIEQATKLPGEDLPEELFLFVSRVTPLVNVDLLIKDEEQRTLLTWRDDDYYGAGWHVPGGIIRYKERAEDRVRKVAETEIGCAVEFDPTPEKVVESIAEQRNRGHFVSLLYRCRLAGEPDPARRAGKSPKRGEWAWHSRCPAELIAAQQMYAYLL
ncbi:MAG: NUDIX domain-containing protein [Bryobacteraceae bacterium]